MGMFDTVIDESGEIDRELQLKCFGKRLRMIRVGDSVVLYRRLDDAAEARLHLEVIDFQRAGSAAAVAALSPDASDPDRFFAELSGDQHPRFGELLDGVASDISDFQVAVSDGTFLTVRAGVLSSAYDTRDGALMCVDRRGFDWDGDPRSAIQSPAADD